MSQSAKAMACSEARAESLARAGMPMHDLDAAEAWAQAEFDAPLEHVVKNWTSAPIVTLRAVIAAERAALR